MEDIIQIPKKLKPQEHRKHNHFTQGRTGYDPKLARLMYPDKKGNKKKKKET